MNNEERKNRLRELLQLQKQKELMKKSLEDEKYVKKTFEEAFGSEFPYEILSREATEILIKDFTDTFPIAFWNRIEWENNSIKKWAIELDEIKSISTILQKESFDTSKSIYVFWEYNEYPGVKTTLQPLLLQKFEEIICIGRDMYYYCPVQKFVIEFFHDGSINIGWVNC
ncbi:hypothetical protein ACFVHQ_19805 [Actinomycetes bacterium NPDC127524]